MRGKIKIKMFSKIVSKKKTYTHTHTHKQSELKKKKEKSLNMHENVSLVLMSDQPIEKKNI